MRLPHDTDGYSRSQPDFLRAVDYWRRLFDEFHLLNRPGWSLLDLQRFRSGALDLEGGALLAMENQVLRKGIRVTQDPEISRAFLIAHLSTWDTGDRSIDYLCCYCCPSRRVEALVVLLAIAWMEESCTTEKMSVLLDRFLLHETFEDDDEKQTGATELNRGI